ncbi:MAG: tetratricopeptide repeat protein, partial [Phycisphaerales bacterium]|nr:tetratricopeptide repeat protein [Phycisphaerales bacterium]
MPVAEPGGKPRQPASPQPGPAAPASPRLRDLWQAPTLIVGAGLLVPGLAAALSARPPFDMSAALDRAETLLHAGQAQEALSHLNAEPLSHLNAPTTSLEQRRHFHLLLADALDAAQRQHGLPHPENNRRIVEEYERVEAMGHPLDAERIDRTARALAGLKRHDEALRRVGSLSDEEGPRRIALRKHVARSMLDGVHIDPAHPPPERSLQDVIDVLGALTADPAATDLDRLWAVARQAELRIRAGYPAAAIDHLLPALHRLQQLEGHEAGELFGLLGRSYFDLGQVAEAEKHLARAEALLDNGSDDKGRVQLMLARCSSMRGEREESRERFAGAVADFGSSDIAPEALLGLAEAEAALGAFDRALDAYTALLDVMEQRALADDDLRERLNGSLRDRTEDRTAAGEAELALRFAALGERLHRAGKTPAWTLLALAENNRAIGERLYAGILNPSGEVVWEHVDPVTRAQIRRAFGQAASRFREHARSMIGQDEDAYGRSLWAAGECFDRAGDLDMAIAAFSEYASGRPNDARRFGARFRLAQSHQARGDFVVAADLYRGLIREDPSSGERFRSIVPLVQCLLADQDPGNDAEGETMLISMLSGGMSPEAPEFRLALNELGGLYY